VFEHCVKQREHLHRLLFVPFAFCPNIVCIIQEFRKLANSTKKYATNQQSAANYQTEINQIFICSGGTQRD
jgi:hypothetical protein